MVERLAALLRFSLDASERGLVPLADELKIVRDYLEIERARLGERLSFTLDVDADAAGRRGPAAGDPDAGREQREARDRAATGAAAGSASRHRSPATVSCSPCGTTAPASRRPRCGPGTGSTASRPGSTRASAPPAALTIAPRDGGTLVTVALPRTAPMTATGPLRAFLVDDEPLALKRLARMLDGHRPGRDRRPGHRSRRRRCR